MRLLREWGIPSRERCARRETPATSRERGPAKVESTAKGDEGGRRRIGGGRRGPALTRVIRQPRRCRRCRRAPTSTMCLVLSHTQGVSRPHILLRRGGPRRERERIASARASVSRGDLRASERASERETELGRFQREVCLIVSPAKEVTGRRRRGPITSTLRL